MVSALGRLSVVLSFVALHWGVPSPAIGQFPPDSFTNLRVLPKNIPSRELINLMAGFTRALGVRCSYCHVGEENQPLDAYDFPSDDKLPKRRAREMLRMVERINAQYLTALEGRSDPPIQVQCATCHRGIREPRPLQDLLLATYRVHGLDSTIASYRGLRARYYGRASYDFGEVALADVAAGVIAMDRLADGVKVLELNVELLPGSAFARREHAFRALQLAFENQGAVPATRLYRELQARYQPEGLPEDVLNRTGYALLGRRHVVEAVAALRLNVEEHPGSWNAHDSLGEGLAALGDVNGAIESYERSLALNPENPNGRRKREELMQRR